MTVLVDKLEKELARNCCLNNWDLGFQAAIDILKKHNAQLLIERDLEDRVNKFAQIMLDKLIKKSRQGWNDWQNCHPDVFRKSLIEHIEKGDPIDVANIAFFLYQLKASTNKPIENLIDADVIQDEYQ